MAREDDDFEYRRRRDRDDYDDERPRSRSNEYGPLDKMYMDTAFPLLIIFGFCCGGIALILSVIALATAKQPEAKSRATTVAIIGGAMTVIGIVANIVSVFIQK
jgi:hypothetical protein